MKRHKSLLKGGASHYMPEIRAKNSIFIKEIAAAVDEGVPAPVMSAALFGRFESRGDADYADRILSAMRKQFGGHNEITKEGK